MYKKKFANGARSAWNAAAPRLTAQQSSSWNLRQTGRSLRPRAYRSGRYHVRVTTVENLVTCHGLARRIVYSHGLCKLTVCDWMGFDPLSSSIKLCTNQFSSRYLHRLFDLNGYSFDLIKRALHHRNSQPPPTTNDETVPP